MKTQATAAALPAKINGLNVQAAQDTIGAIAADKSLARFQFRARNRWVDGTENRSTISDFYGAGREDTSRRKAFEYISDEPAVLFGNDAAANAGEFLLHTLAGCVTTTFVLHAMARGIVIRELSTELEGDIDLRGALGLDESVNPGFEQIRVRMDVKADCTEEELEKLFTYAREHSPIYNTISRPTQVVVERVRK